MEFENIWQAREAVVEACREMTALGINQGTSGNVSVRYGDVMLISPSGIPYDVMQPGDIVEMKMNGEWTASRGMEPSSEWRFHLDILRELKDVNAVVHAHPIYCTTLAILNKPIPPVHYMIAAAGGDSIPCVPYATYGTEELSHYTLAALQDRKACLMANHGMIATGSTLKKALWLALEVEVLARQYHACLQVGEPVLLTKDQIDAVLKKWGTYGLKEKKHHG
ncbi:L-fuculose-phosphate aldolase [Pseudomonas alloputida]|uniref:L-fuculose-phosphate aldolase n=2 Tax=Pseudomonas TaxID=286 RepID=A0A7W2JH48_9PSED|nr:MULTISPECIES: L-fuculose-phosphate aldolase [Pseudomonas]MBA1216427.1 L-fuculose-phosphate aldolase [Pseudomonas fulva]MBA1319082.1 L-fuculose-phosphate aldolase [Pseudomonas monteilii]MBA6058799.1 L-fuculose-phosphate aldolase [Pseudomonas juntendi]MBA6105037.1 L-fuculose-phosphate aldolase [Pseudomonas monteilii]MBA6126032.1 L-fuculose-phosphate aldolase [Pseudomonas juntendi]